MPTPWTLDQLLELFGKLRDNSMSADEFAKLQSVLREHPDAMALYRRFMAVCSGLEQLGQLEGSTTRGQEAVPSPSLTTAFDTDNLAVEAPDRSSPVRPSQRSSGQTWAFAIAVCLVVAYGLFIFRNRVPKQQIAKHGNSQVTNHSDTLQTSVIPETPITPELEIVLADAIQASWAGSAAPQIGSPLKGEYVLASGAARIKYPTGASLLVQAPAIFLITEPNRFDLRTGAILADIPEPAHGFRIDTPWGAVIDHGTQMGVLANDEEGIEVHGLEGLIELRKQFENEGLMLKAGDAASLNIEGGNLQKVTAVPDYFARSLDELADLPQVEGDVELRVSPPKAVRRLRSELVDVGRVTIFPERRGQSIDHVTRVTFSEPGRPKSFRFVGVNIPRNTRLDSYTMHFSTPRKERMTDNVLRAQGSVTFPRPIRGVRTFSPNQLAEEFGCPFTDYSLDAEVGLEDPDPADPESGDWLELSEDRKTLRFRLRVHGRGGDSEPDFLDQFRILVDAVPEPDQI